MTNLPHCGSTDRSRSPGSAIAHPRRSGGHVSPRSAAVRPRRLDVLTLQILCDFSTTASAVFAGAQRIAGPGQQSPPRGVLKTPVAPAKTCKCPSLKRDQQERSGFPCSSTSIIGPAGTQQSCDEVPGSEVSPASSSCCAGAYGRRCLPAAVQLLPAAVRRCGGLQGPADVADGLALVGQLLSRAQLADDQSFCGVAFCYGADALSIHRAFR